MAAKLMDVAHNQQCEGPEMHLGLNEMDLHRRLGQKFDEVGPTECDPAERVDAVSILAGKLRELAHKALNDLGLSPSGQEYRLQTFDTGGAHTRCSVERAGSFAVRKRPEERSGENCVKCEVEVAGIKIEGVQGGAECSGFGIVVSGQELSGKAMMDELERVAWVPGCTITVRAATSIRNVSLADEYATPVLTADFVFAYSPARCHQAWDANPEALKR